MSGLTLTLLAAPDLPLDVSSLQPGLLAGQTIDEIRALPLRQGRVRLTVGDFFAVAGTADGTTLTLKRATERLQRIGAGMASGSLVVHGAAGVEAGAGLRGGTLLIKGDAGDGLALGMRSGRIDVTGNAGDSLGAPAPGDVSGMRGGSVFVDGTVGDRCGDRMRRGLIGIGGDAGNYCGSQLVAGSLILLGNAGEGLGQGMRRGSILLLGEAPLGAAFSLAGTFQLAFLAVLVRHLVAQKPAWRRPLAGLAWTERWVGDAGNGGLGEILRPA